jgi:hypothetical protein
LTSITEIDDSRLKLPSSSSPLYFFFISSIALFCYASIYSILNGIFASPDSNPPHSCCSSDSFRGRPVVVVGYSLDSSFLESSGSGSVAGGKRCLMAWGLRKTDSVFTAWIAST